MFRTDGDRSPAFKLFLAIAVGVMLAIPLFSVWLLVYDRQSQSQQALASITAGWGGPQGITGPVLVIPYRATATETVVQDGRSVTRSNPVTRELALAPETVELSTEIRPEVRKRSIYEAVVYETGVSGIARFAFPDDLAQIGVDPSTLDLGRAELRFGLSDPRGLGAQPRVTAGGGRSYGFSPAAGAVAAAASSRGSMPAASSRRRSSWTSPTSFAATPRSAWRPTPATRAGRFAPPGRIRASAGISCRRRGAFPGKVSKRDIGSATLRSAARS